MIITENDFANLFDVGAEWGIHWREQVDRFESGISYTAWKYAYWFEMSYPAFMMAREFLNSRNYAYAVTSDEAGGWVILTNYDFEKGHE